MGTLLKISMYLILGWFCVNLLPAFIGVFGILIETLFAVGFVFLCAAFLYEWIFEEK